MAVVAGAADGGPRVVGQDNWLAYVAEARRTGRGLEQSVGVVEVYKCAVDAEPASLKIWLDYCEYFWTLYCECHASSTSTWPPDDQALGREIFSLESALHLWQQAYDAIKYRLADSHELWCRWIALETEQLARDGGRTPDAVRTIVQRYRDRLAVPHCEWDATAQAFSSFLSEYCPESYESTMLDVTSNAQPAKQLMAARERFEDRLRVAAAATIPDASTDLADTHRRISTEYLEWEVKQVQRLLTRKNGRRRNRGSKQGHSGDGTDREILFELCCALFERFLVDNFASDEDVWLDYVTYLSIHSTCPSPSASPDRLLVLRRAVQHCPVSSPLWSRYLLYGEEAKLSFTDMEAMMLAATDDTARWLGGMDGLLDVYAAWCGFLCRWTMCRPLDLDGTGIPAAIEAAAAQGLHRFGADYLGDPKFRLERILVHFLTEKNKIKDARSTWDRLAQGQLYADSHEFWRQYYDWEMSVYKVYQAPDFSGPSLVQASAVLSRALCRPETVDCPEKLMDVALRHCGEHERPDAIRHFADEIHTFRKAVARRRDREAADVSEQQQQLMAQEPDKKQVEGVQEQTQAQREEQQDPSCKRKRESNNSRLPDDVVKRTKTTTVAAVEERRPGQGNHKDQEKDQVDHDQQRDRENTSVLVTGLAPDTTQTKIKQYFKDYGHVKSLSLARDLDGAAATSLIEFASADEAQSALLRDGKYFGQAQISVRPGRDLILYVTNYPPDADEARIRALFTDRTGGRDEILSVRWPSLKYNTHRRFCYVSFRTQAAAAAATSLDGTFLPGGYQLVAKLSDPGAKKVREGAIADGRELHLSHLAAHAATESFLRELCARHGTVASVTVPQSMAGRPLGFAFVVFDRPESAAAAAADLHLANVAGSVIGAEVSRESRHKPTARVITGSAPATSTPAPGDTDDISGRTVVVSGLPDTVNDARLAALLAPHGVPAKLLLRPAKGSASAEFRDPAVAARAARALDGHILDGATLHAALASSVTRPSHPPPPLFTPTAALRRPGPRPGTAGLAAARGRLRLPKA